MDFAQVEAEFRKLKQQYQSGTLTQVEFKAQLEKLMVQDEQGRWWMIGYETGQWYYHDGNTWVRGEAPRVAVREPLPSRVKKPAEVQPAQARRGNKALLFVAIGALALLAVLAVRYYFTPTPPPPVPPLPSGTIPFYSPTSPNVLNPSLVWSKGGSTGSTYAINGDLNTLTLTAGPDVMNWATAETSPMILYQLSGDFEAQVEVMCDPSLLVPYSGFGFGVRSRSDHFTWLQFERSNALFATQDLSGAATTHLKTTPYGGSAVSLKIKRIGDSFSFSYSENGDSWVELVSNYVFSLPQQTEIYLFVFTPEGYSLSAQFSDLRVFK